MKKSCKILFLFVLIIMLTFCFTISVNADTAVDDDGFEILEESKPNPTTQEPVKDEKPTVQPSTTEAPETTKDISASPVPHVQAGKFNSVKILTGFVITVGITLLTYLKVKKYNY